jgi:hypothetical protein
MNHILKFQPKYFIITLLLLSVELFIALFVHDNLIRPYIGDLLVVILIYCFIKSFFNLPTLTTAISVLLFSFLVEALQYFKIVYLLGLQNSKIARIIIGTSFAWQDIIAYIVGIIIVILVEKNTSRNGKAMPVL